MKDYTDGKIKDHPKLICNFDGGCEPRNPGGICTAAWVLYDGGDNEKLAAEGKIVRDGRGQKPPDKLATNNFAEYCALGLALRFLVDNEWRGELTIYSDSKLVVNQVTRNWKMKAEHLKPLRQRVWDHMETLGLEVGEGFDWECFCCDRKGNMEELIELEEDKLLCPCGQIVTCFNPPTNCSINWVPREQNEEADSIGRGAYEHYLKQFPRGPKK